MRPEAIAVSINGRTAVVRLGTYLISDDHSPYDVEIELGIDQDALRVLKVSFTVRHEGCPITRRGITATEIGWYVFRAALAATAWADMSIESDPIKVCPRFLTALRATEPGSQLNYTWRQRLPADHPRHPRTNPVTHSQPPEPLLVDETSAARMLAVSPAMIRKLWRTGRLPSVKVGRLRRYRIADLERIAEEGVES